MAVKTTWPVEHSCGHDEDHDLSERRPSERASYARWLAGRECSDCWTAKRDRQNAKDRDRWVAERRAEESAAAEAWEKAADMPALDGRNDKAVEWGRRVRHQLMVAAHEHAIRHRGGRRRLRRAGRDPGPADQVGVVVDRPARRRGGGRRRACPRRCGFIRAWWHGEPVLMDAWSGGNGEGERVPDRAVSEFIASGIAGLTPVREQVDGGTVHVGLVGGVVRDVGQPPTGTWLADHPSEAAKVAANLDGLYGSDRAAILLDRAGGDRFFAVWLELVDHWLEDVPPENRPAGFPWRAAYEQGWRPHEAVSAARDLSHSPEALEDFGLIDNAAEWRPEIG